MGAITTVRSPAEWVARAMTTAMMVLPLPTSPASSLFMGVLDSRSRRIELMAFFCELVSVKGSELMNCWTTRLLILSGFVSFALSCFLVSALSWSP